MKTITHIVMAIFAQGLVFFDVLFLQHLRSILKTNPSLLAFFLLYILPYFFIGLFLSLSTIQAINTVPNPKKSRFFIASFFIIFNLLLIFLNFSGAISLSSITLPLLLIGYGLGELIFSLNLRGIS